MGSWENKRYIERDDRLSRTKYDSDERNSFARNVVIFMISINFWSLNGHNNKNKMINLVSNFWEADNIKST